MPSRPLSEIAEEIRAHWKPTIAAKPYLDAMAELNAVTDDYFQDSGRSVVLYFLSNARSWKGDVARRIKSELKDLAA